MIEAAGLAHRSWRGGLIDTFRDRAMLPVRASDGTIVAFIGRAPDPAETDVPKYLNSRSTSLYRKREVLFGLWQGRGLLAHGARPVIVEGPFDAIAVTAAGSGQHVGLAPCGTALTTEHIAALSRLADLPATGVIVAFDPDPPGRRAAVASYHLLSPHTETALAVVLPAGQDPACMLARDGPAALNQALAQNTHPLADLVVDEKVDGWSRWLRYPEGQINALRSAAPLVAAMPPSHVARQVARLAHRLGLDYATVTEAVTDALPDIQAGPRRAAARDRRYSGSDRVVGGEGVVADGRNTAGDPSQVRAPPRAAKPQQSAAPMASRDFPPGAQETVQHVEPEAAGSSRVTSADLAHARMRAGRAPS